MVTPERKIRRDTRIFVSAVSSELGSVRKLVKRSLETNDYHVVEQETFPPDYRLLVDKLRERISSCDAIVHIVGKSFGSEPKANGSNPSRRSYTQLEFDVAKELGIPTLVFISRDAFVADEHELENSQKLELQHKHREELKQSGTSYTWFETKEELDSQIRSIRIRVDALHNELTSVDERVNKVDRRSRNRFMVALAVFLAVVSCVGFGLMKMHEQSQSGLGRIEEKQKELSASLVDPIALAAKLRRSIHAVAKSKIEQLDPRKAGWQAVVDIEAERDRALDQVDECIEMIVQEFQKQPSDVFQLAVSKLENAGVDQALAYLESVAPGILKSAEEQLSTSNPPNWELQRKLRPLLLAADLYQASLEWEKAIQIRKQVARLAPDWFEARNSLGLTLLRVNQYRDAEPHLLAATSLAHSPVDQLLAMNNLAQLLHATNRVNEAEPMMRTVLSMASSNKEASADVSRSLNNLATLLLDLTRYEEAERLLNEALKLDEAGKRDVEIAKTLNNLGQVLVATNRLKEAEPMMRRSLSIAERTLPSTDPQIAVRLNNLGRLLEDTNRPQEAEKLIRKALSIDINAYGEEHVNVATRLNNLGSLLQDQHNLVEAEKLYRRALAIDEKAYGQMHPIVARDLSNIGQVLQEGSQLAMAESYMRRCLDIRRKAHDRPDPLLATALVNLGTLMHRTGRISEAEPLMREALAIDEKNLVLSHPNIARDLNNLANLLADAGRFPESQEYMARVVKIFRSSGSSKAMELGTVVHNQAMLNYRVGEREIAEKTMREALEMDKKNLPTDHPNIARDLANLGEILASLGRKKEAEELLKESISISERSSNVNSQFFATASANLGSLLYSMDRRGEAETYMRRALQVDEKIFPKIHPDIGRDLHNLGKLLQATNRKTEAETMFQRSISIFQELGPSHPSLSTVVRSYVDCLADKGLTPNQISATAIEYTSASLVADAVNSIGVSHLSKSEIDLASQYFGESVRLFSTSKKMSIESLQASVNLAVAQRELGEVTKAKNALVRAIASLDSFEVKPLFLKGRARYHLAMCEFKLQDFVAAERIVVQSYAEYRKLGFSSKTFASNETVLNQLKQNDLLYSEILLGRGIKTDQIRELIEKLSLVPKTNGRTPLVE